MILSVPFEHTAGTLKAIRERLAPGQIVVSMGVPLASRSATPPRARSASGRDRARSSWRRWCPRASHVVSAFQNVSAHRLQHLADPVECDVVVSGEKEPRARVMELCALVPGLRGIDGGPLANARIVESITALLIGLNIRYRVSEGIGVRFTGIPDAPDLGAGGIPPLISGGCESGRTAARAGRARERSRSARSRKSHARSISCTQIVT